MRLPAQIEFKLVRIVRLDDAPNKPLAARELLIDRQILTFASPTEKLVIRPCVAGVNRVYALFLLFISVIIHIYITTLGFVPPYQWMLFLI